MLGLEKGKVRVVEYDLEWPKKFDAEKENLMAILEKAGLKAIIAHVGSTSIKGMKAKPIIDIAVGLANKSDQKAAFNAFREAGIEYVSAVKLPGLYLMAKGNPVLFYYHLVVVNTYAWDKLIIFRNYLRRNLTLAKEYEKLKLSLADEYKDNRPQYAAGKQEYVQTILLRATGDQQKRRQRTTLNRFKALLKKRCDLDI